MGYSIISDAAAMVLSIGLVRRRCDRRVENIHRHLERGERR